MKAIPEVDRKAYELAKSYLPSQKITGVTQALIEKYQNLSSLRPKPTSRNELYERLLRSAQNAGMKSSVIGDSIGGVDKLSSVLYDFSPKLVLANYEDDWEAVLDRIIKELKPRGKIRKTSRSLWPLYCQTIISAARFIEQFDSANQFFEWVDFFDQDAILRLGKDNNISQLDLSKWKWRLRDKDEVSILIIRIQAVALYFKNPTH